MLRRTIRSLRRSPDPRENPDQWRVRSMNRARLIYDAHGNIKITGLLKCFWYENKKPIIGVVGICGGTYAYINLLVLWLAESNKDVNQIDKDSEIQQRRTGKLKSERYLTKPRRQIDDPDLWTMPAYGSKEGEFKSKLFHDDEAAVGIEETSGTS